MFASLLTVAVFAAGSITGASSPVHLVTDLNKGIVGGTDPDIDRQFLQSEGNLLYFIGNDGQGSEIWCTDGNPNSTYSIGEIIDNLQDIYVAGVGHVNGKVLVAGTLDDGTCHIWSSDGARVDTIDLLQPESLIRNIAFIEFSDYCYFSFEGSGTEHSYLYKTDGTLGGTSLLWTGDFCTPPVVYGNALFFLGRTSEGRFLWRSNGTSEGTGKVSGLSFSSVDSYVVLSTDKMFFACDQHLWMSDGTGLGTSAIATALYGVSKTIEGTSIGMLESKTVGAFTVTLSWPTNEMALYHMDGQGSTRLATTSADIINSDLWYVLITNSVQRPELNGKAYFLWPLVPDRAAVIATDGTVAGTSTVTSLQFDEMGLMDWQEYGRDWSQEWAATSNAVYFVTPYQGAVALWRTDGTEAGTFPVFTAGASDGYRANIEEGRIRDVTVLGDRIFFVASKFFESAPADMAEVYVTDGTVAGTRKVKDVYPGTTSSDPRHLCAHQGKVYFIADDGVHGYELWKTDGTEEGTSLVKDIKSGTSGSNPSALVPFEGGVAFTGTCQDYGAELRFTDGTEDGTILLHDMQPGEPGSDCSARGVINGSLYWTGDWGIYKRNGLSGINERIYLAATSGSSPMVYDDAGEGYFASSNSVFWTSGSNLYHALCATGLPSLPTSVGDIVYFVYQYDDVHGNRKAYLHKIDPGDVTVKAFDAATVVAMTNLNGTLCLLLKNGNYELWTSDGTEAGTVQVKVLGPEGAVQPELAASGDLVFFQNYDAVNGVELWCSDGTASGTHILKDINPGISSASPCKLTAVGGTLYFAADNGAVGQELWASDGTPEGTALVKDILPGPAGSRIAYPAKLDDFLVFFADDGVHGTELWGSSGAPGSAMMLADICEGFGGSYGGYGAVSAGTFYFPADDGIHGLEMWAMDMSNFDDPDGDGISTEIEGFGDFDGDGDANYLDDDSDDDGLNDIDEGTDDVDSDGAPNFIDSDSDDDGVDDGVERFYGYDPYDASSTPSLPLNAAAAIAAMSLVAALYRRIRK